MIGEAGFGVKRDGGGECWWGLGGKDCVYSFYEMGSISFYPFYLIHTINL